MKNTRNIIIVMLTCLLLCGLVTVASAAGEYTGPTLFTSEFHTVQGQEFTTTLNIAENSEIVDFQIRVKYDSELMTFVSAEENEDVLGTVVINSSTPGYININYTRTSANVTREMPIADITFRVDDNVGVGTYSCLALDTSADNKADRLVGDELIEVDFVCDFAPLKIFEAGDVNIDGLVQITDVTYLRRHLAKLTTLSEYQLLFADACYDENVDITDAVFIQRKIAQYDVHLGNRVNVYFYDIHGELYATKSVVFGANLLRLPTIPEESGYANGRWSLDQNSYVEPDLTGIEKSITLYAVYEDRVSEAMEYYKNILRTNYYSGNLPTGLSGNLNLVSDLIYQGDYTAKIYWSSSNNATMNASTGQFSQPTYDSQLQLTATIISYKGGIIESTGSISFDYSVNGVFVTPSKLAIETWLRTFFENGINYDLKLPMALNNSHLSNSDPYEVRISWEYLGTDGNYHPISRIERSTQASSLNLVATLTFGGTPLEGNGKVYFDAIPVTAIEEIEIRRHIIDEIATSMGLTLTTGETLWNDDNVYGSTVRWLSNNVDIATIANNNTITISNSAVNGTSLPLTAQVTYDTDQGAATFNIAYTVSVATTNALLVPGTNIDADLYDALKAATDTNGSLTTDTLKDVEFVYLDLSDYPDIRDLRGLTYCTNLRVLNISGLQIDSGINEIATLSKLEALIARGCNLDNLSDGGIPVLKTMINLKLLDLSDNNLTNLDSVLDPNVKYGKLSEVYLQNNRLSDISGLSRAPALSVLVLSDNSLTSAEIAPIEGFPYLQYLSLANNEIDNISALRNLKYLQELRLQNNLISSVRDLKTMSYLRALYLGNNQINANIEFLDFLTELRVLYLNDNRIEDISSLTSLTKLEAINVSNNHIQSLNCLEAYSGTLKEVYAENNEIRSFAFVQNMTGLRKLMLSGNEPLEESSLSSYLSNLTNLETLTLSGKPMTDLSFLAGMTKLIRLDIADCRLPAYYVNAFNILTNEATGNRTMEITEYADNLGYILALKGSLKFLDMSNNNMAYSADEIVEYMENRGYSLNIVGITFTGDYPTAIGELYELGKIVVFYADNINKTMDAGSLTTLMTGLKYVSFENCGITDMTWLSKFRNLIYVDLANNSLTNVELGTNISTRSKGTLQELYLDTNSNCSFAKAYISFDENVLRKLSLKGINVAEMANLPYMDNLEYLNLADTGITCLQGEDPDFYEVRSIERYNGLKTVVVTGLHADISCLLNMDSLETVYAIADPNEYLFYETNIHVLQSLYNKGVDCYLYSKAQEYEPLAQVEGANILGELEDASCTVKVAAENMFSDNNPYLPSKINDFDIVWTVSNSTNYEVKDNYLSVKDYANIDDEALTLTASIIVYSDQAPATREFTVQTDILRASNSYYSINAEGLNDHMTRNSDFSYDVAMKNASTEGFTSPVKPVVDEIHYAYSSTLEGGSTVPYTNILTVLAGHVYSIGEDAPLASITTITVTLGHNLDGEFITDDTIERSFVIDSRTFMVTYVCNEGTIIASDGSVVTSQRMPEDTVMFQNITISRTGYIFEGLYLDPEFNDLFWDGNSQVVMPAEDIILYAKWRAHSFTMFFDANGGTTPTESQMMLCDSPFGELPVPSRDYYTFNGWFTSPSGGTQITANTSIATADDITAYAQWTLNPVVGWVLSSEMPSDAQLIEEKWSYTLTTNTESTDTTMAGFEQVGSYWVESTSDSFNYSSAFPSGFDANNTIYKTFKRSPYTAYENETEKRTVSNSKTGYVYWHWMYSVSGNGTPYRAIYHKYGYGPDNNYLYKYFGAFLSSKGDYANDTSYCNSQGIRNYIIPERTANNLCQGATRWFRFDYYTCNYTDYYKMFQYSKVEDMESPTEIIPSDTISNVCHWVTYRNK